MKIKSVTMTCKSKLRLIEKEISSESSIETVFIPPKVSCIEEAAFKKSKIKNVLFSNGSLLNEIKKVAFESS